MGIINILGISCDSEEENGNLFVRTPFSLKDEIKAFDGARWNPESRRWYFPLNFRNKVALKILSGEQPYREQPIDYRASGRPVYAHQIDITKFQLSHPNGNLVIGEMGVGKTLAAAEALEQAGLKKIWFVSSKNALNSVIYDWNKWKVQVKPDFITYDRMKTIVENKIKLEDLPDGIVFDEASNLKTLTSQRTQAAKLLLEVMREKHSKVFISLMTGTPAPKNPLDWYSLCELAVPGFLREGNIFKFRNRLAVTKRDPGVVYDKIVTWKDNPEKCNVCGELSSHFNHNTANVDFHQFIQSDNEVEKLHKRLQQFSIFKLKKDCLDLPEKVYREIKVQPTMEVMQAAQLIKRSSRTAIEALNSLRQLSDGFQYVEQEVDVDHDTCEGAGCSLCMEGKIKQFHKGVVEMPTPKDQVVAELLEEFDTDRTVLYAGFTESINRIERLLRTLGWKVLRVDGRGWFLNGDKFDAQEGIKLFQDSNEDKLAFVGHPGSAGMGLTLTRSNHIIYYSNDFNGVNRMQSEDRIHRIGSRGANIIDLLHLPTDKLVLKNLKQKKELQALTLGDLDAIDNDSD